MVKLEGKNIIVTGGAGYVGRCICEVLGQAGASIVIVDKNELKAQEAYRELTQKGLKCRFVKCDVSNSREVQAMVDNVLQTEGKVDVLVNSAGSFAAGLIEDISEEVWDEMIDTHLKGTFLTCRAVLPHMQQACRGKIVNLASVEAKQGFSLAGVHYSAAKGGVMSLTRQLALQVSPLGIHVNCVAPGPLEDEDLQLIGTAEVENLKKRIPLGRFAKPEDIAYAVLFLASPMADFLTGETIDVNGGKYLA